MTPQYLKITKLAENPGGMPAASSLEYEPGSGGVEGKSMPIDYQVEGFIYEPITVGSRVYVDRRKRNGVPVEGFFMTTAVVEVNEVGFRTENSVYLVEYLPTPNPDAGSA